MYTTDDIEKLSKLAGKPFIGVDAEWKCSAVNAFDRSVYRGPAILQLASDEDVFLIDILGLKDNNKLDLFLS